MTSTPEHLVEPEAGHESWASVVQRKLSILAIFGAITHQGFTLAILAVAAPFIGQSFRLNQTGIAGLYAWISLAWLGSLGFARLMDRVGRQRTLLWCSSAAHLCALGVALTPTPVYFALLAVVLYSFTGAIFAGAVVMLAEELPIDKRATGQSLGGLASGVGRGVAVLLMPLIAGTKYSWRWLYVVSAAMIVFAPLSARTLKETERFERERASGATAAARIADIFSGPSRKRAIGLMTWSLLGSIAASAAATWSYYYAVAVVGLAPAKASALVIVGGLCRLAGLALGAWTSDHFGRVPTVMGFTLASSIGWLAYFLGPLAHFGYPALWLGGAYACGAVADSAAGVGEVSAVSELFPTSIRATMMGAVTSAGAIGALTAQVLIAILAGPAGGLSYIVSCLVLLGIPSAIVFGVCIDETRGLSLEAAAMGDPVRRRGDLRETGFSDG